MNSRQKSLDRFSVIDLETTGLSPADGDRITEVGIVLVEDGKIVDRFQSLVNPLQPIPSYVQNFTGITDAMVANAPVSSVVLGQAADFIGDRPLVAHNAAFERKFLQNEFSEINRENQVDLLCTLLLTRRIFPNLESYELGKIVSRFKLPKGKAHRALSDAEMTAHLLLRLKKEILKVAPKGYVFSADNLFRITKVLPKEFRETGLANVINVSAERYKRETFRTFKFISSESSHTQNTLGKIAFHRPDNSIQADKSQEIKEKQKKSIEFIDCKPGQLYENSLTKGSDVKSDRGQTSQGLNPFLAFFRRLGLF